MTTSTIELPSDLHQRICAAAQQAGTTAHDMILQAIEDMLDRNEAEVQEDDRREQELMRTGLSIPHTEVLEYFERRARARTWPSRCLRSFSPEHGARRMDATGIG